MTNSNEKITPFVSFRKVESTDKNNSGSSGNSGSSDIFDVGFLKEQNTLGTRITEARKAAKLSQKELSEKLADYRVFIKPGSISKWEKGDAMPNPYQLLALCHLLHINDILEYFTGITPQRADFSPELNQKGLNILKLFKETLIASGNYAPRSRRAFTEPAPELMVKVFSTPAAAGTGSFMDDEDYDMIGFDPSNVPDGTEFGIRVTGDSMLPRYVPGQIVFVEQCKELYPGEIGVFICNGNAYIKQYRESAPNEDELEDYTYDGRVCMKVTLYSLNRDRADCDVHITPNDRLDIVGRVLS